MDAGLSLIMTNHAKVKKNDFVFDPFVGTGEKLPNLSSPAVHGNVSVNNFTVLALCFRKSVGSMLTVWCLRLWSRY